MFAAKFIYSTFTNHESKSKLAKYYFRKIHSPLSIAFETNGKNLNVDNILSAAKPAGSQEGVTDDAKGQVAPEWTAITAPADTIEALVNETFKSIKLKNLDGIRPLTAKPSTVKNVVKAALSVKKTVDQKKQTKNKQNKPDNKQTPKKVQSRPKSAPSGTKK